MKRSTPAESTSASIKIVQKSRRNATSPVAEIPEEEVRCRAYQLYEEGGCQDGRAAEDWLQAETEMSSQGKTSIAV